MRFKRHIRIEQGLGHINTIPMMNTIVLLLFFIVLSSSLTSQPGINVKLPKAVTSDKIREDTMMITITSEDVIYLEGNVMTTSDLKRGLAQLMPNSRPVLIKADRRSSMGRIADVWEVCRELGIERINIATTKTSL